MASIDKKRLWQEFEKACAEMDAAPLGSAEYRQAKKRKNELEKQLDEFFELGKGESPPPDREF